MSDGWPGVAVAARAVLVLVVDNAQNLRLRDVITIGLLATSATSAAVAPVIGEPGPLVGAAAGGFGMTPWFGAPLVFAVGCVVLVIVSRNREDRVPTSPAVAAALLVSVVLG